MSEPNFSLSQNVELRHEGSKFIPLPFLQGSGFSNYLNKIHPYSNFAF